MLRARGTLPDSGSTLLVAGLRGYNQSTFSKRARNRTHLDATLESWCPLLQRDCHAGRVGNRTRDSSDRDRVIRRLLNAIAAATARRLQKNKQQEHATKHPISTLQFRRSANQRDPKDKRKPESSQKIAELPVSCWS